MGDSRNYHKSLNFLIPRQGTAEGYPDMGCTLIYHPDIDHLKFGFGERRKFDVEFLASLRSYNITIENQLIALRFVTSQQAVN